MPLKIAIHEPAPMSAVSYYRSLGTLSYLYKLNKNIDISTPSTISWDKLIGCDILYMERPQEDSHIQAMIIAKEFNLKIWVDYDDCLHEVPEYNPSYKFYNTTHALKNVEKAMKCADVVTVSTNALKEYYSKFNKNIFVIENAHNDYQYPFIKKDKTTDTINWRGSNTHRKDLLSVSENMFNLSKRYTKWNWVFIGNDIWYITDNIQNCFNLNECDVVAYNKFIKDLNAAIQINPLLVNQFNKCKSNISWLEGTFSGSCSIVPDMPEFQKPGAINYNEEKKDHFGYMLEKAINSKEFRRKNYLLSYNYIKENLLLSKINQKRLEIVEMLR